MLQRIHVYIVIVSMAASLDETFFFEQQPKDEELNEGDEMILSCTVTSPWISNLEYIWYKQATFGGDNTVNNLETLDPIPGQSGSTIDFSGINRSDTGYYHCMVNSAAYKLVSNTAYIQVNYFDEPLTPVLETVSLSENLKYHFLTCKTPVSFPIMDIMWMKDDAPVSNERIFIIPETTYLDHNIESNVILSRGTLMISNVVLGTDDGHYICQTKDEVNGVKITLSEYTIKTTTGATLIDVEPSIVYSSQESPKIIAGTSVTMVCAGIGYPTPNYQWYLVGPDEEVDIRTSDSISIEDHNRRLVASNVVAATEYKCVISNTVNNLVKKRQRNFYATTIADDSDYKIDILMWPSPFVVLKPNWYKPFDLECAVRLTGNIKIQWLKNLKPISDRRIIPDNSNIEIDGKNATSRGLKFIIPNESDLGLYQCVMFNDKGMKIKATYVKLEKEELQYSLDVMQPEYFMLDGLFKVDTGEEACRNKGSHLVSILSDEENKDVANKIPDEVSSIWIGLTREKPGRVGAWLWTQPGYNSTVYSNWIEGKPDSQEEEYAIMKSKSKDSSEISKWEDVDNKGMHNVMCKTYISVCKSVDRAYDGRVRTAGWEEVNTKYVVGQKVEVFCRIPGKQALNVNKVTCGPGGMFIPKIISEKECSVVPSSALFLRSTVMISVITFFLL